MENFDQILLWFSHGLNIKQRIIYLENDRIEEMEPQEVGHTMTSRFIKAMAILESIDSMCPITIILNTPGGEEYAGFAIYDRIRESNAPVTIRGYGHIMSMGSIIMQAGDIRQVSPEAYFMIHDGYNSIIEQGAKTILSWGKHLDYINTRMYDIYFEEMIKKDPKINIKKIQSLCKIDTIYNAREAVDVGLADTIYYGEKSE